MATKLYLRDTSSDFGTGNNDANLRGTAIGWIPQTLSTSAAAVQTSTGNTSTVAGTTPGVEVGTTPYVWYSPPLDADVTISGSITWNIWAAESNMSANVAINGRLEVIDGATGAITLIDQTARTTEVAVTTPGVNNFAETPAAGVACKRGDRLRVRIFADDVGTMASGYTFIVYYNSTVVDTADTWLQLTENLTFVSEPAGTTVYLGDHAASGGLSTASDDYEAWTSRVGPVAQTRPRATVTGWTAPIQLGVTSVGNDVDWFTRPLAAFTLGGAVRVNARVAESNASANVSIRCEVARVAGDGTSPTVWGATTYPEEMPTTQAAQSFLVAGDDLAISDGQRLRIRFYIDDSGAAAMATGFSGNLYHDGTTGGASGDTYLTFTQTLTEFTGIQDISPGLINQTAVASAPVVELRSQFYTPALITQTAVAHQPTVFQQRFYAPALINQTAVTFAPSVGRALYPARIERITRATSTFYSEPFNGSSLSGDWAEYAFNDIPVTVAGGNLVVTFASGGFWGQIDAASNRNLTGRILSLEITQIDDGMGLRLGSQTSPDFYDESDVYVHRVGSDYFVAARNPGFDFTSVNLGATLPERIQIREQGGVWHYGYVVGGVLTEFETLEGNAGFPTAVKVFIAGFSTGNVATVDGAVASTSGFTIYESDQIFGPTVTATRNLTIALLNQTAVASTPTVIRQQFYTPALLNQTAVASAPSIQTGAVSVSLGLIDQTATTSTPTVTSGVQVTWGPWSTTFSNAVSAGAQNIDVGLLDETAATFNPTVTATRNLTLALLSQTAVTFAPAITTGVVNISLALIDRTAVIYAPGVVPQQFVVPSLINQTAAAFTPTVLRGAVSLTFARIEQAATATAPIIAPPVLLPLLSQAAATFSPTVTSLRTLSVALINQTAAISAPTLIQQQFASFTLINQTAVANTPTITVGATSVALSLLNQTATPFSPTVTTLATVSLGLISQTATASAPTVTSVRALTVGLIPQTAAPFSPAVTTGPVAASVGRIDQFAQARTPTISAGVVSVELGLISQTAVVSAPAVGRGIALGLIVQTASTNAPAVTRHVHPAFINASALTFAPSIATDISLARIERVAASFTPTIVPDLLVELPLLDQSALAHEPLMDTGQVIVILPRIEQAATVSSPAISTGVVNIALGRIDVVAATGGVAVATSNIILLPLLDRTATTFAPAITTGAIDVSLELVDQPAATFGLSVSVGAAPVVLPRIDQTAAPLLPVVSSANGISLELINSAGTPNAPVISVGAAPLSVGRINQPAATFAPTLTTGGTVVELTRIDQLGVVGTPALSGLNTISLGQINRTAIASAPGVGRELRLPLLESTAAAFDPVVSAGGWVLSFTRVNQLAAAFGPAITTGVATISLARIERAATASVLSVAARYTIVVGRISQPATALAPSLTVGAAPLTVGRIERAAFTFTPTVIRGAVTVVFPRVDQPATALEPVLSARNTLSFGRINQIGTTFTPSILAAAPGFLVLARIDQSAAAFSPSVSGVFEAPVALYIGGGYYG